MAGTIGFGVSGGTLVGGAVAGVASLAVGGFLLLSPQSPQTEPQTSPATRSATASEDVATPPLPLEQTVPEPPRFDVIRVDPDGNALIAGTAWANTDVSILLNNAEVSVTQTDDLGAFVQMLSITPRAQPQLLALRARDSLGALRNSDTVIIAPSAQSLLDVPNARVKEESAMPNSVKAPASRIGQPTGLNTPAVFVAREDQIAMLQPPGAAPETPSALVLDTIAYNPSGDILIDGRANPGGFVRLYLDNAPAGVSPVGNDGRWTLALAGIASQLYTLRADRVDNSGAVQSRIEIPFKPESVTDIQNLGNQSDANSIELITVQPGNTLWAIAQDSYGAGTRYLQVFEANSDKIRDPDLIYPGQVFELPKE